ncbi:MAG TPA: UvrD-helicase domain-containing protein, partial [Thermoguttaceae bacterium]|nr:UvrD-helicase domain-containing protein [Thermoguttaceae bacterium]
MSLNAAQREAVNTLTGPLLVLAGAGTGKTRVVMYRVVNLIRHGTKPSRILAVTFTNKAAREMQERAAKLLKTRRAEEKPEISTFHSLCVRILRRQIHHLGYPAQFAIYDRGDQTSVVRGVLHEIKLSDAALRPEEALGWIGRWKMADIEPAEAASSAQTDKQHLAASVYRRYQATLKSVGAVDFDDLLGLTTKLLARRPEVRRTEAGRFDHVMVDEYQDTNPAQYELIKALAGGHRNLAVVGDDDQSIYGWRGAKVTHILRFKQDWPEAKVVRLETNYRSTTPILEWSNRLIAFNKLRHDKTLRATVDGEKPRIQQFKDETAEAKFVVDEIEQAVRSRRNHYSDFAVLFRTNEQPRLFEEEFRRAKVPYVLIGGTSFFDRKEIRDVLAYLKLLVHPRDDVSLLRVINTPPR